ncbi:MAG TPA: hypothetical protein VJ697_09140 [Nitrososphaeraceae archaeon]|nr:hypothetical protein [Nitrososphaeraceae archaeon]
MIKRSIIFWLSLQKKYMPIFVEGVRTPEKLERANNITKKNMLESKSTFHFASFEI